MKTIITPIILLALIFFSACEKFLSEKSDKSLVLADKLKNLQALLDHPSVNQNFAVSGEGSTDDYYLTSADFDGLDEAFRNQYTWQPARVFAINASRGNAWNAVYRACYLNTMVLEALADITYPSGRKSEGAIIKGQALANRAYRYLNAVSIWSPAYDESSADADLGIPLRLEADFNVPTLRTSVAETFRQIIQDTEEAIPLLPVVNINAYRANRPFAYSILARTYWYMRDYEKAMRYADSCLQLHDTLIDFNTLNADANFPIAANNPEVIRHATYTNEPHTNPARAKIPSELYTLYTDHDLRKFVFFSQNDDGTYRFKGNYSGSAALFAGVSTSELLLIRAEGRARNGNVSGAVSDVNRLLTHRIHGDYFTPVAAATGDEALSIILAERRKELVMRGLRWMDIKRLNKEDANITMTREIDGNSYTLPPNDLRYALAIPEDVIEMTGIPMNPR